MILTKPLPPSGEGTERTHHARILRQLRDAIISGHWQPGRRIPFEKDMAEQYGVSRMTMNKVLTQLTSEGFLERRRKMGTFVRLPRVKSAVLEIIDIEREISDLNRAYSYSLVSREVRKANEVDKKALALTSTRQQVLHLCCIHNADGVPFCFEDRIINLKAVPAAATEDFETTSPGRWLLRLVPWSSAHHVISAVNATPELARRLKIKTGTACLEVIRTTSLSDVYITRAQLSYPGYQHQLVADFSPQS